MGHLGTRIADTSRTPPPTQNPPPPGPPAASAPPLCLAAAYTCADVADAIVSINTLMNVTTKAVTASITLACNGTFTDCNDTMSFAWRGNTQLKKPAGLALTIAAAPGCATGDSRPLMSSTLSNLTNDYMIYMMQLINVRVARSLAARGGAIRGDR